MSFRKAGRFCLENKAISSDVQERIAEKIPELEKLSPEEKLLLVGELWDELAANPKMFPTRQDHVSILRERLEHFRLHPHDVVAWEDVKARILSGR